jgi:hypothetical protein
MLKRTMITLMSAALVSGISAAGAQARGSGMHMHMAGGHSGEIHFGGHGQEFRRGPRFGAYGDWSVNCSPLGWQPSWPDVCF